MPHSMTWNSILDSSEILTLQRPHSLTSNDISPLVSPDKYGLGLSSLPGQEGSLWTAVSVLRNLEPTLRAFGNVSILLCAFPYFPFPL